MTDPYDDPDSPDPALPIAVRMGHVVVARFKTEDLAWAMIREVARYDAHWAAFVADHGHEPDRRGYKPGCVACEAEKARQGADTTPICPTA